MFLYNSAVISFESSCPLSFRSYGLAAMSCTGLGRACECFLLGTSGLHFRQAGSLVPLLATSSGSWFTDEPRAYFPRITGVYGLEMTGINDSAAMELRDKEFYEHVKRMRVDPSRQSVNNPTPGTLSQSNRKGSWPLAHDDRFRLLLRKGCVKQVTCVGSSQSALTLLPQSAPFTSTGNGASCLLLGLWRLPVLTMFLCTGCATKLSVSWLELGSAQTSQVR